MSLTDRSTISDTGSNTTVQEEESQAVNTAWNKEKYFSVKFRPYETDVDRDSAEGGPYYEAQKFLNSTCPPPSKNRLFF